MFLKRKPKTVSVLACVLLLAGCEEPRVASTGAQGEAGVKRSTAARAPDGTYRTASRTRSYRRGPYWRYGVGGLAGGIIIGDAIARDEVRREINREIDREIEREIVDEIDPGIGGGDWGGGGDVGGGGWGGGDWGGGDWGGGDW